MALAGFVLSWFISEKPLGTSLPGHDPAEPVGPRPDAGAGDGGDTSAGDAGTSGRAEGTAEELPTGRD
ncbi:hypothetical protein HFP72_18835 [Nocardiopsis sp. ARC36]